MFLRAKDGVGGAIDGFFVLLFEAVLVVIGATIVIVVRATAGVDLWLVVGATLIEYSSLLLELQWF